MCDNCSCRHLAILLVHAAAHVRLQIWVHCGFNDALVTTNAKVRLRLVIVLAMQAEGVYDRDLDGQCRKTLIICWTLCAGDMGDWRHSSGLVWIAADRHGQRQSRGHSHWRLHQLSRQDAERLLRPPLPGAALPLWPHCSLVGHSQLLLLIKGSYHRSRAIFLTFQKLSIL